jgi:hypothetical protein
VIHAVGSDAKELIGLAARMGIPTEDAFQRVLQHLTDRQLALGVVEPGCSLRRPRLSAGTVEGSQCTNRKINF